VAIWQVDFYRRPLADELGPLWELVICDASGPLVHQALCPQANASAEWLKQHLQSLMEGLGQPEQVQAFRPQTVQLLQPACAALDLALEPTRHTPALKQQLQKLVAFYPQFPNYVKQPYQPVDLDKPPPLPLPENLWGERWRFAALAAMDLVAAFQSRPIPICDMPESRFPVNLSIPSTTSIPGVVVEAGRRSMQLARWLQQVQPVALSAIPGDPDGLILEAGLIDRWVFTTYTDPDVIAAAQTFRSRQQAAQGLHFLLVQPDDSGMTYSGFWLLQSPEG
jgi:RNA-binding protein Tab2/Atab2